MTTKELFAKLPHKTQIEVIKTLFDYSDCIVEGNKRTGRIDVCTALCLKSHYDKDEFSTPLIKKAELGIVYESDWYHFVRDCENKLKTKWEKMTRETMNEIYKEFDTLLTSKAEEELKRILG